MFPSILIFILIAAGSVFFAWLAVRAWRSRNLVLKVAGGLLSGLAALIFAIIVVVGSVGLAKFSALREAPVPDVQVAGTPEQVARGQEIANYFCASCHSVTNELPLSGGMNLGNDFPMPLGSFVSSNLTPAGPLSEWSDGEIFRAIRNGIDKDGRRLLIMSTARGRNLSDEDIKALIAYLRSQPAVENPTLTPPDQPSLLGYVLLGAGMIPEGAPPSDVVISAPAKGATIEYGEYILDYQDCRECHGQDLTGGKEGQLAPIGPGLRVVKGWTAGEFISTMRTGVDPNGHALDSKRMPWKNIGRMDDAELTAIHMYLSSLP